MKRPDFTRGEDYEAYYKRWRNVEPYIEKKKEEMNIEEKIKKLEAELKELKEQEEKARIKFGEVVLVGANQKPCMLSRVSSGNIALICLGSGNRYYEPYQTNTACESIKRSVVKQALNNTKDIQFTGETVEEYYK